MNLSGYFTRRRPAEPEVELVEAAPAPAAVEATHEIAVPGGVVTGPAAPAVARTFTELRRDRPIVADDPLAAPGVVDEVDAHADDAIAMLRAERDTARQDAARARSMLKDANGRADEAAHYADQAARAASIAVQRANAADLDRGKLRRALDEQRPAPDVGQLAAHLKSVWLNSPNTLALGVDLRWKHVAQTAIDAIRGPWPIEAWPLTPGEVEQPAPTPNSPGGGADAEPPHSAAPSPPGDPTATGPLTVSEIAALDAEADRRLGEAVDERVHRELGAALQKVWPYKTSPGGLWKVGDDITGEVARRELPDGAVLQHVLLDGSATGTNRVVGRQVDGMGPQHRGVVGHATYRIRLLPETSPGGGMVAEAQEAPTAPGAPAPGDPTPEAEPDPARETLAQALARSELQYLHRTWPEFTDQVRDEYRSMADDVIAAGWQPPAEPDKP